MTDNFEVRARVVLENDKASLQQVEREIEQGVRPEITADLDGKKAVKQLQQDMAGMSSGLKPEIAPQLNSKESLLKLQKDLSDFSGELKVKALVEKHGTSDYGTILEGEKKDLGAKNGTKASKGPFKDPLQALSGMFQGIAGKIGMGGFSSGLKDLGESFKGLVPGMGGGEAGGAAAGAGAGAMAGAAVGLVVEGIKSIVGILEKLFNLLVESSPMLNASVKMISKAIMLFLMPIGNTIAQLLRPFVKMFMQASVANLKNTGKNGNGMGGLAVTIAETVSSMLESMVPIFVEVLVQVIPAVVVGIGAALLKMWVDLQIWIVQTLVNIWIGIGKFIFDAMITIWTTEINFLLGIGKWILDQICGALSTINTMLGGFPLWLWNQITGAIGALSSFIGGLGTWLWNQITGAITGLGTQLGQFAGWIWGQITGLISSGLSTIGNLGTYLWNTVTGIFDKLVTGVGDIGYMAYKTLFNVLAGIPNGIRNIDLGWPLGKPFTFIPQVAYLADGGIVTHATNAVIGEAGPEAVIPLSKMGSMGGFGGDTHLHLHIAGNVIGVADLEKSVTKIFDKNMNRMAWR